MLCERIKSKIPSRHKGTPRQHSLKKILIMVRLLILSLFPCNKDSKNLLQKNMLEICSIDITYGFTKSLPQKKPIFFTYPPLTFPKTSPDFLAFLPRLRDGTTITAVCCATSYVMTLFVIKHGRKKPHV